MRWAQTEPWQHLPRAPKITQDADSVEGSNLQQKARLLVDVLGLQALVLVLLDLPTRRGETGWARKRGRGRRPRGLGACFRPPEPTRCTITDPVGGDSASSRPTQAGQPRGGRGVGGACIHPPGPTRCTVTDPVGGDSAQSRPTQAERRERARGARGLRGELRVATAGSAWSDDREIVCEVGGA